MTTTSILSVPGPGGGIPVHLAGDDPSPGLPGLLCVPSIYGPAPDLLAGMASLADVAVTAVMDPFWRDGRGAVDYGDRDTALARIAELDREACAVDIDAVTTWLADRCNGSVVGLGICFGGPWVLRGIGSGRMAGAVTWHGSRMEQVLDSIGPAALTAPVRLHFGGDDPVTPPEAVAAIGDAFADHPDCRIVVHPGAVHGFSHEGPAWDAEAAAAGMADLRAVLLGLAAAAT